MQFKNVSGSTQDLPTLDLRVPDGETFEATGTDAKNLQDNPAFKALGGKKRTPKKRTSRAAQATTAPDETPLTSAGADTEEK